MPPARRVIVLVGLVLVSWSYPLHAEPLRAGSAKVDITPPIGYPLWGYAVRKDLPSTGVLEPLFARAVVLEVGKSKVGIVSLDLGRPPTREIMAAIRGKVQREAGIETLFLSASHTHHGPVLELKNWPSSKKPWVKELEKKLIDVLLEADRKLEPAHLLIASARVPLNRNRHSRRDDRPVDDELIVVRVEAVKSGKTLAHLVNFAAHPTILEARDRRFSPDFPGALARLVEKEAGGTCLFLQGPAGDLSPNIDSKTSAEEFGRLLGRKVLNLAWKIPSPLTEPKSLLSVRRTFRFDSQVDLENPFLRSAFSYVFFKDLVDFYAEEYRPGIRPELTTTVLDQRIGLVGVSGEFFCGHALHLKRRARLEHLLFLGYCNDYQQYFPTIEAVAEGGYGADLKVAPVEVGAGERIMDQALRDLYELRGKIPAGSKSK